MPGTNPGTAGCQIQYKKQGETAWRPGLAMWYDARNSECRGSLVQLTPGTTYDIQVGLPGQTFLPPFNATTWADTSTWTWTARTVEVPAGTQTLNITDGGTPGNYVVYQPVSTDAANVQPAGISINASYVIVRGFTVRGAQQHGIIVQPGQHD